MSVLDRKKFNFFSLVPCNEFTKFKNLKLKINAYCYNVTHRIFCDDKRVHIFSKNWESIPLQISGVKLCAITPESNHFITIVEDSSNTISLQILNLNKLTKKDGAPPVGSARLPTYSTPTVIAATCIGSQICITIGFDRGDLFLYRGQINGDLSSSFRSYNISTRSVTGICFRSKDANSCFMFVSSDNGIFSYSVSTNNNYMETKRVLDNENLATHCSTLYEGVAETYFVVGRDDGVYCFTNDDLGPSYPIKGHKKCIAGYGNYLVTAVQQLKSSVSALVPSLITVIDINNKMIVLSKEIDSAINGIIVDRTSCFIITEENAIYRLIEKDLKSKLNVLVAKNLYDIGLRLIEESNDLDDKQIAGKINLQFGDYLLLKGDVSLATEKYINTIGYIEPYCIIRSLLNTRNNKFLADYLLALSRTEFANEGHMELLRNCNELLNLSIKIENNCLNKQPLAEMCYNDPQLITLESTHIHLSDFITLSEEQKDVHQFFKNYSEEKIYEFFMENGEWLMIDHGRKTINILKNICSEYSTDKNKLIDSPDRFIPFLLKYNDYLEEFLEHVILLKMKSSTSIFNFLFELYLRKWEKGDKNPEDIIEFLTNYGTHGCMETLFFFCKQYSFWPGIMYIHKNFMTDCLNMQHFPKICDLEKTLESASNWNDYNIFLWIQSITKEELLLDKTVQLINKMLTIIFEKKNQSLLQILQNISSNSNLLVLHIKNFFMQQHLKKDTEKYKSEKEEYHKLFEDVQQLNKLLTQYSENPIEFRSSVCDMCRKQLTLPAVHFLCQHSFHKECIRAYSETELCVVCAKYVESAKVSLNSTDTILEESIEFLRDGNVKSSLYIIENISKFLATGVFNELLKANNRLPQICAKQTSENLEDVFVRGLNEGTPKSNPIVKTDQKPWVGRYKVSNQPSANNTQPKITSSSQQKSSNPFEEDDVDDDKNPFNNYDDNLNPFQN